MEPYYSVRRDEEYLPVPPLLVSASGLENYLGALSKQLGRDIYDVKKYVETSCAEVNESTESVKKIKRYLATKAINEMDGLSQAADAVIAPYTERNFDELFKNQNNNESEKDMFDGMMSIAGKLIQDNTRLMTVLEENTSATNSFVEFQQKLIERLEEVNRRLEQQQRDLHELSVWLGTYDNSREATKRVNAAGGAASESSARPGSSRTNKTTSPHSVPSSVKNAKSIASELPTFEGTLLRMPSDEEIENYIAHSPLLLAFRRILLKDMTERMTHSTDVQAKEMGTVVSGLKTDIGQRVTAERVVDLLDDRRTNETQNLVFAYGKRLKEIESNYVRREEFSSLMRTKADTLLLPVKADSAEVSELEKRLFNKYADLAERVAYFEAEREEFRNIVRSFVNMQQSSSPGYASGATAGGERNAAIDGSLFSGSGLRSISVNTGDGSAVGQQQPYGPATGAGGSSSHPLDVSEADPRGTLARGGGSAVEGRQVYRVVGSNRSAFATPVNAPAGGGGGAGGRAGDSNGRADSHAAGASSSVASAGKQHAYAKSAPPGFLSGRSSHDDDAGHESAGGEVREAIGMTANQAAYANYVTRERSKNQVESLPPLPYERMNRKP